MPFYEQLKEQCHYIKPDKVKKIHQAYLMALEYHSDQKRADGEQYIAHPVAVAENLLKLRVDYQSITAALLHDLLEDTVVTKEEIAKKFGETVADLVDGVTKLKHIDGANKSEAQTQNFRKMILAMSRDIRVILIKLADRLHNMQTIDNVVPIKRQRIARETLDLYAPIANRLGMYTICIQLEDLAFAALYPRRYGALLNAVKKLYGENQEVVTVSSQKLHNAFAKSSLKNVTILGRMKHIYGIYRKMLSHKGSFANIMDIYAFRVIVKNVDDCYRALGIVHNLYKPLPGKFRDYIAIPKFNGYQSLHTVLFGPYGAPVEIQIRTTSMDHTANDGIAAHWLYKAEDVSANATHIRTQQWVNKLLEMQQQTGSSTEFFESVKVDLFPDRVYVFTPKGDIIELMRGATVIDFAYALHSKIGNSCIAARINRQFSPLSTVLGNGQTVSIVTSEREEPNPSWLSFVVTSRARNSIRQYLKHKKRVELITLGKRLLDKACTDLGVPFYSVQPATFDALVNNLGFKKINDLYENIGLGNLLAILVAYQLIHGKYSPSVTPIDVKVQPLTIYGTEGVAINFAQCCYPVPGDTVIGHLDVGRGLEVHVKDCKHLKELCNCPDKCLPVAWMENIQSDFRVALNVELIDTVGVLASVVQAVYKTKTSIYDLHFVERNHDYAVCVFVILVKNISHLERIIRRIARISSVLSVIRKKS